VTPRIAIVGHGFMGRTHEAAFAWAASQGYTCMTRVMTADEAVRSDEVDAVCICTPTDTHVEIAAAAMRNGKHVLVEKPVSLRASDVDQLADVALKTKRLCMPAHCMRFWPGWPFLRDIIENATYGALRSAAFRRIAATPDWNDAFYLDRSKSGGALFDLHIHDVDFILWCFGEPHHIECEGSIDHMTTRYAYDLQDMSAHGTGMNAPPITAEGGWLGAGTPFSMHYHVELEHATIDFVHDREPSVILTRGGSSEPVHFPAGSAYELQAAHFVEAVAGHAALAVTLADAARVIRCLEREASALRHLDG
jgi:predicted dehydrogenase